MEKQPIHGVKMARHVLQQPHAQMTTHIRLQRQLGMNQIKRLQR